MLKFHYLSRMRVRMTPMLGPAVICAVLFAIAGLFSYGGRVSDCAPESYLSSTMISSLHRSDLAGFMREVERLASVDQPDAEGMTPLMASVMAGRADATEYLLSRGANANSFHRGYGTPLIHALRMGELKTARTLLQFGADPGLVSATGDTPLLAAARSGCPECIDLILACGVDPMPPGARENPLNCLANGLGESEAAIDVLLKAGVDPNRSGLNGERPVISAAAFGSAHDVRALLAAGADPDLQDAKCNTAWSVCLQRPEVRSILQLPYASASSASQGVSTWHDLEPFKF